MIPAASHAGGIRVQVQATRGTFSLEIDLSLSDRGVSALSGRSGSGKTTILRTIAGLERGIQGRIQMGATVWQDSAGAIWIPPERRGIGYVFQEANLFPHLTVRGNLLYGQRRAGARAGRNLVEIGHVVDLLGIGALLERSPDTLSGGERQRVAIARALLSQPRLLLLDEPLASLDLERKREVLPYLERLHEELEVPVILVSHAMDEVARVADHLTLLREGRVVASGPLGETLARVDLPEVHSQDVGAVVDATVTGGDERYGLLEVEFGHARLQVVHERKQPGRRLRLQIQARDVSLALEKPQQTSVLNLVPAVVVNAGAAEGASHVHVTLDAGGTTLVARITRLSRDRLQLVPGTRVWAQIKAVAVLA